MKIVDKIIQELYHKKGKSKIILPFYLEMGKYRLCVYAMDLDWKSLRIKIEKDSRIIKVIKKGLY